MTYLCCAWIPGSFMIFWGSIAIISPWRAATIFSIAVAALCLLDGFCRHAEFRSVYRFLRSGRTLSSPLISPMFGSLCQREVLRRAAKLTGNLSSFHEEVKRRGYKWYHVLPDNIIKYPLELLSLRFFKTSFMRIR